MSDRKSTPFGPEVITIAKHTQYSLQDANHQYYKVNAPLTMAHFQDGLSYTVSGAMSAKGNKYISKMEPVIGTAKVTNLPPAPPIAQASAPQPSFTKKDDNVPGKVACVISNGIATFVSGIVQDEVQFVAKYESLMKQIMDVHKKNGWL